MTWSLLTNFFQWSLVTIAAMAGAIAACMYPIPAEIADKCYNILSEDLREINDRFMNLVQ